VHAIAAQVHERTAAQRLDVPQLARRVGQVRVEDGLDVPDAADGARTQRRQRLLEQRMEAIVETFEHVPSRGARRGHDARGILGIVGERLLDQHVFAAFQRRRAPLEVRRRWQRAVHELDVVTGHQLGIAAESHRDRMLGREVARTVEVARRDRDDLSAQCLVSRGDDAAWRDSCRAQDADANHGPQSRMTARPG
jgi:hypothetical protein